MNIAAYYNAVKYNKRCINILGIFRIIIYLNIVKFNRLAFVFGQIKPLRNLNTVVSLVNIIKNIRNNGILNGFIGKINLPAVLL